MSTQALDRGYRSPRYYPVYLDLRGRRCVVVGGGGVALARAQGLVDAGGDVTVISSKSSTGLDDLSACGQITLLPREYQRGDLSGVRLAIDARDGAPTAQDMGREAAESGTLLNIHDQPMGSGFITPAVVDRHPLLIAISTCGESPYAAAELRRRLAGSLGEEWGHLVALVGGVRRHLRESGSSPASQRKVFRRLMTAEVRKLLRQGQAEAAAALAARLAAGDAAGPGQVALVGAGPGDPGLLTLAACEVLGEADIVFYDALVHPGVLALCPPGTTLVNVGKRPGHHGPLQAEITAQLLESARAGLRVVRLKGGDPLVFGRGGEEMLELTRAGVRVTVIPGVSSVLAVPAAAGIPLTMRGVASSVGVVTGHEDSSGDCPSGLEAVAAAVDTLVVLMPLGHLEEILARLAAVRGAAWPAVLVGRASWEDEKVVRGSLGELAEAARRAGITAPATLVAGEVVGAAVVERRCAEPATTLPQMLGQGGAQHD
jgi:uroporphyrin-III C-methyltransferase/precorrin-2 dehydrogenase/sirohydrochlorin ferrochelatase